MKENSNIFKNQIQSLLPYVKTIVYMPTETDDFPTPGIDLQNQ